MGYREISTKDELRRDEHDERALIMSYRVLYFFLDLMLMLLLVRFALKMFGAQTGNALVYFLYAVTNPLVAPFLGIVSSQHRIGGSELEWATPLAVLGYSVLVYIIIRMVSIVSQE